MRLTAGLSNISMISGVFALGFAGGAAALRMLDLDLPKPGVENVGRADDLLAIKEPIRNYNASSTTQHTCGFTRPGSCGRRWPEFGGLGVERFED